MCSWFQSIRSKDSSFTDKDMIHGVAQRFKFRLKFSTRNWIFLWLKTWEKNCLCLHKIMISNFVSRIDTNPFEVRFSHGTKNINFLIFLFLSLSPWYFAKVNDNKISQKSTQVDNTKWYQTYVVAYGLIKFHRKKDNLCDIFCKFFPFLNLMRVPYELGASSLIKMSNILPFYAEQLSMLRQLMQTRFHYSPKLSRFIIHIVCATHFKTGWKLFGQRSEKKETK